MRRSMHMSAHMSIHMSMEMSMSVPVHFAIHMSIHVSVQVPRTEKLERRLAAHSQFSGHSGRPSLMKLVEHCTTFFGLRRPVVLHCAAEMSRSWACPALEVLV